MNNNIDKRINEARRDFGIKEFPSNFFEYIVSRKDYINKYNLALFKQNLGEESSGFICYTNKGTAFICINYYRTLGHQNFTLAHEIGHMYLHKGTNYDDTDESLKIKKENDDIEAEANEFAAEFLYPMQYVKQDVQEMEEKQLLNVGNEIDMGNFVNKIAMKYCISFRFALLRILFNSDYAKSNYVLKKADNIMKEVSPLGERYSKEFYSYGSEIKHCKPYIGIIRQQKEICDVLIKRDEIGIESAEAINSSLKELEGSDETFI